MISPRSTFAFLPALGLLAGCAVGPNYQRPDTQAPAAFRDQPATGDKVTLSDTAWWDLYSDPALTALVKASLENGFDTRIAASRVEEAHALAMQTNGRLFPSVGYTGDAYRGQNNLLGNPNPAGTGATTNGFAAYLSAAWEPDLWGRLRRLNEVARDQYLQTDEARKGIEISVVTDVATDYFQLLELDQELSIAREADQSFGESLKLFNQRLKGGVASRLETASAEAAQAAEAARIPNLERQLAATENELSVLLGRPPGPVTRGPALSDHAAAPQTPVGLPSDLLERRPDVRSAEYAAMSANAQIGAIVGSFLPRIGLSAALGGVSQDLSNLFKSRDRLWSVGAQITGPIFQAGTLRGQYLQSKAAWEEAKLRYEQTALSAFADVSNALSARQKLGEERVQLEREVRAYTDAVNLSTERYKAGQASYYEVLQAKQLLFPAEVTLAQTQRDELVSVIQLYKALGGGWNPALITPK